MISIIISSQINKYSVSKKLARQNNIVLRTYTKPIPYKYERIVPYLVIEIIAFTLKKLVRSPLLKDSSNGAQKNINVKPYSSPLDIGYVKAQTIIKFELCPPNDLPKPC